MDTNHSYVVELKAQIITGILAFPGDNLKWVSEKGMSTEKAVAILTNKIFNEICSISEKNFPKQESMIKLMGAVAQGLLTSPHDNLNHANRSKRENQNLYNRFAEACLFIVNEQTKSD